MTESQVFVAAFLGMIVGNLFTHAVSLLFHQWRSRRLIAQAEREQILEEQREAVASLRPSEFPPPTAFGVRPWSMGDPLPVFPTPDMSKADLDAMSAELDRVNEEMGRDPGPGWGSTRYAATEPFNEYLPEDDLLPECRGHGSGGTHSFTAIVAPGLVECSWRGCSVRMARAEIPPLTGPASDKDWS